MDFWINTFENYVENTLINIVIMHKQITFATGILKIDRTFNSSLKTITTVVCMPKK